ncbi:hypothetical protein DFJ73DRAFT_801466 [Zopfochytrium polystomum]|nr:hypothetical protein DFJ73DRAFT_801466 [Zopfochytrium polystomum]
MSTGVVAWTENPLAAAAASPTNDALKPTAGTARRNQIASATSRRSPSSGKHASTSSSSSSSPADQKAASMALAITSSQTLASASATSLHHADRPASLHDLHASRASIHSAAAAASLHNPVVQTAAPAAAAPAPLEHVPSIIPASPVDEALWPLTMPQKDLRSRVAGLSLKLSCDRGTHVTSEPLTGRLEIHCTNATHLKIGKIQVHLFGIEETGIATPKTHTRHPFLANTVALQTHRHPPTAAVTGGPHDEHGMWPSRAGVHRYDFRVPPPASPQPASATASALLLPSSAWFPAVGGVRYLLAASVEWKRGVNNPAACVAFLELPVAVQGLDRAALAAGLGGGYVRNPGQRLAATAVADVPKWWWKMGGGGSARRRRAEAGGGGDAGDGRVVLRAECQVLRRIGDGGCGVVAEEEEAAANVWVAGSIGYVEVAVENESKKKVKSLTVSLVRRLKSFTVDKATNARVAAHFSRTTVSERTYVVPRKSSSSSYGASVALQKTRGDDEELLAAKGGLALKQKALWAGVRQDETRTVMAELVVPIHSRSIQNATLIEVSYVVQVTAFPQKRPSVSVEIPITILHPSTVVDGQPKAEHAPSLRNDDGADWQSEFDHHDAPPPPTAFHPHPIVAAAAPPPEFPTLSRPQHRHDDAASLRSHASNASSHPPRPPTSHPPAPPPPRRPTAASDRHPAPPAAAPPPSTQAAAPAPVLHPSPAALQHHASATAARPVASAPPIQEEEDRDDFDNDSDDNGQEGQNADDVAADDDAPLSAAAAAAAAPPSAPQHAKAAPPAPPPPPPPPPAPPAPASASASVAANDPNDAAVNDVRQLQRAIDELFKEIE